MSESEKKVLQSRAEKKYTKQQKEVASTRCKQVLWLGFKLKTREIIWETILVFSGINLSIVCDHQEVVTRCLYYRHHYCIYYSFHGGRQKKHNSCKVQKKRLKCKKKVPKKKREKHSKELKHELNREMCCKLRSNSKYAICKKKKNTEVLQTCRWRSSLSRTMGRGKGKLKMAG